MIADIEFARRLQKLEDHLSESDAKQVELLSLIKGTPNEKNNNRETN
jgi:hypothetical protein